MPKKNGSFDDFSFLLSKLIRKLILLERSEKVCAGETISQCYTIEALARSGEMSITQLRKEMGASSSTMTRVLDILVRKGLVTKRNSAEDRRNVFVKLTAKGLNLAGKLEQRSEEYLAMLFGRIPSHKRKPVNESLAILLSVVEEELA
ncbi:MAG: MarR family transcriptional regulator [Planctomycetes bacterium]|nr:MarR family transcriptional regulator [Planctomycetota bacterium]